MVAFGLFMKAAMLVVPTHLMYGIGLVKLTLIVNAMANTRVLFKK